MTVYAVIDTNVLVSALLSSHKDAATVQVVEKIFSGEIVPLFSDEIMMEYREVLGRKKFHFSQDVVSVLLRAMEQHGKRLSPPPSGEVLRDMKDLPFYEAALAARRNTAYLVTGNGKHFPEKAFIVSPRTFLNLLQSGPAGENSH